MAKQVIAYCRNDHTRCNKNLNSPLGTITISIKRRASTELLATSLNRTIGNLTLCQVNAKLMQMNDIVHLPAAQKGHDFITSMCSSV